MTLPAGRVWRLRLRGVNAYLVADDGLTLVDAGTPWDAEQIVARVESASFDLSDVDRVLLTHYDLDHVGALGDLGLDATVHVAPPDADLLTGRRRPPLSNHKGVIQRLTHRWSVAPGLTVDRVADGDRIGPFRAYAAPGHTPGHTVYVHEKYGVAFVGDLVRESKGRLEASPWIFTYDVPANDASIRRLADSLPPVEVVAMGHGDPVRENGRTELRRLAARL